MRLSGLEQLLFIAISTAFAGATANKGRSDRAEHTHIAPGGAMDHVRRARR